jgi:hypothetical protein
LQLEQIRQILDSQMSALQWIDKQAADLQGAAQHWGAQVTGGGAAGGGGGGGGAADTNANRDAAGGRWQ